MENLNRIELKGTVGTVKVETRFILKWYRVFHIDDTTGIESLCQSVVPNPDISPIDAAEQAIQAYLTHGLGFLQPGGTLL